MVGFDLDVRMLLRSSEDDVLLLGWGTFGLLDLDPETSSG